ncbi:MAG TPA: hypothetical protein PLG43_14960, partial [Spirochaetia bacterium]|nr:hypothetical protein [Spirochaetia bacterium]
LSLGERPLLHSLSLTQAAAASSAGFGQGFLPEGGGTRYSRTDLSVGLLSARLSGFFAFTATDDSFSPNGGTEFRLPLFDSRLVLSDSYTQAESGSSVNFSRMSGIELSPTPAVSLAAENRSSLSGTTFSQEWEAEANLAPQNQFAMKSRVFFRNSRYDPGYDTGGYGENWVESYSHILPLYSGGLKERKGDFTISPSINSEPVGLRLPVSLGYRLYGAQDTSLSSTGSATIGLPVNLGSGWSLTPQYSRSFSSIGDSSDEGFASDMGEWATTLSEQGYLYTELPLFDLFSDGTEERFTEESRGWKSASFSPSVQLTLSRTPSSYIRDLLLPAAVDVSVRRTLSRSGDTVNDVMESTVNLKTRAVNLFGKTGSHPLFDIYNTDDISNAVSLSSSDDGDETDIEMS